VGLTRLLLVEDDETIASMYRLGLEAAGWHVQVETRGDRGLEAAFSEPPTVVLLDIMLPGLNGLDVLRGLRSRPETNTCPVVVLSNSAGLPQAVEEASRLGVLDWMVKSKTTPAELAARLAPFQAVDEAG
jgi:DNA-binding response OmpR family regulator